MDSVPRVNVPMPVMDMAVVHAMAGIIRATSITVVGLHLAACQNEHAGRRQCQEDAFHDLVPCAKA